MKRLLRWAARFLIILCIILCISLLIVGVVFAIYVDRNIEKEIEDSAFESVGTSGETKVYYYDYSDRTNRQGEPVELTDQKIWGGYRFDYTSNEEIPQYLKDAFVAIEDKRFYKHKGVDWFRTITAGANYFLKFNKSYGGSTITQQLVKNVTDQDDFSFQRKIQEIFWALDLEEKRDKNEILEMYLNIINLSQGCYGVGAASQYYFSKTPMELTLSECAAIAAITNSPSYYDPIKNPENNDRRRIIILSEMYDQGYITLDEFQSAKAEKIVLTINDTRNDSDRINSWYVDMVIEDVINDIMTEYGYSRSMASLMLYTGGLKIYTVMDPKVQKTVEEYYEKVINFEWKAGAERPQSSMIIIDSKTGDILGVAGAVGQKSANRIQNYATYTVRPAGSVIKPLSTYAPALEKGIITWSSIYDDTPVRFNDVKYNADGTLSSATPWPKNSNGSYRGLTNINYALEQSVNTVTVKVLMELGLEESFGFLHNKLHLKSLIYSKTLEDGSVITDMDYAALALGQFNYGVTVREITAAYSIFANNGIYNAYRSYYKVTDAKGETVLKNKYDGEAVISKENADIMTLMLQNVVSNGTASDITLDAYVDCAGKTGTTQNKYDNWYIGYTSDYIAGVWMGYEYPKSLSDYHKNRCIKIWDDVISSLHNDDIQKNKEKEFDISKNVIKYEYCADSGKLMTTACRCDPRGDRAQVGYFLEGTQPTQPCDRHVLVNYDEHFGGVVVGECPAENVRRVGLIAVKRSFPIQIYITDAQYTWQDIGIYVLPNTSPSLPFYFNLLAPNTHCGISRAEQQFNRACKDHFNYFEWKKKQENEQ